MASFERLLIQADRQRCQMLLDRMASKLAKEEGLIADHVVSSSLSAMHVLKDGGKDPSLVGKFSQVIYSKRPDGTSLMQIDRMPFGLIEHQLNFFTAKHVRLVSLYSIRYFFLNFTSLYLK